MVFMLACRSAAPLPGHHTVPLGHAPGVHAGHPGSGRAAQHHHCCHGRNSAQGGGLQHGQAGTRGEQ
eukprot:966288-Pelagomonas_calceolata.AAC.1